MIPVFQTNLHNESTKGNCMRASLASIFMLNINSIPRFEEMDRKQWKTAFKIWLKDMGFALKEQYLPPSDKQLYIAIGDTERGILHCVVGQSGKTIHDPHPSQNGLINIKKYWLFKKAI